MTYIMLSTEDVKQAMADYISKNYGDTILSKVSSVTLQPDREGEYLYPDCDLLPIKVVLNRGSK